MDWLGLQLTSMLLFMGMCFSACVVPAIFSHRLQQGSVCSEVINYLNCVSGGVFAATFFIMYNHINSEFEILLSGAPIWQERFVLGAFIVFLGFLLTGLVEKLTDYFQHRDASKNATFPAAADAGIAASTRQNTDLHAHHPRHSRDAGSSARLNSDDAEELSPLNVNDYDVAVTPTLHDSTSLNHHHAIVYHHNGDNGFHQHAEVEDGGKNYISMEQIQPTDTLTNQAIAGSSTNNLLADNDSADTPNFNFHQHSSSAAAAVRSHSSHSHGHHHHHHLPDDFARTASMKRFIIILASLSAHSVFEGMALGVQTNRNLFVKLFVSILLHEVLMAMAVGLSLGEQRMVLKRKVLCAFLFSAIIPIGQIIGILMQKTTSSSSSSSAPDAVSVAVESNAQLSAHHHHHHHGGGAVIDSFHAADADVVSTTSAVVQALAVGTFLYVTFFEILPERMHRSDYTLLHVGFTIIGFLLIPVASILQFRHS